MSAPTAARDALLAQVGALDGAAWPEAGSAEAPLLAFDEALCALYARDAERRAAEIEAEDLGERLTAMVEVVRDSALAELRAGAANATEVAAAVEEQTAGARDIASNTQAAADRVREAATAAGEAVRASDATRTTADTLRDASARLQEQGTLVQGEVERFLVSVRAA